MKKNNQHYFQFFLKNLDLLSYFISLIVVFGFILGIFDLFEDLGLLIIILLLIQIIFSLIKIKIINLFFEILLVVLAIISFILANIHYILSLPFILVGVIISFLDLLLIKSSTTYTFFEVRSKDFFKSANKIKKKKNFNNKVKEAEFEEKDI